jgi:adenylate cyclase
MSVGIRDTGAVLAALPPPEAAALLRKVWDEVAAIVHAHGGMLDRRSGIETLALFNAPLEDAAHVDHAVQAAGRIALALDPLNATLRAAAEAAGRKYIRVHLDTGIESGSCMVGNLVSDRHPAWTAIGSPIENAAGIGRLCREYGVPVVLASGSVAGMAQPRVLELDLVRLQAGAKPIRIFVPVAPYVPDRAAADRLAAAHARMIARYRNGEWAEAEDSLRECRSHRIEALATLYSLYRTRIVAAREIAPPAGWEGARLGSRGEIDLVTEITPAPRVARHSEGERDQGA